MIDLSPKVQFQQLRKEDAEAFANYIAQPAMRTALTYAFAHFGAGGVTPEELTGAKKFIRIFSSMSEPDPTQQPLPAKTLSQ